MWQSDLGVRDRRRIDLGHDPPVEHDQQPVGERHHLVEFGRHDQHRGAVVALFDDAGVDVLDRADVDAAGRLGGDDEVDVATELPGDDHLLLVAAGQGLELDVDVRGADVVLLDQSLGFGRGRRPSS